MMRLAIDVDSTLHHYWDVLSAISRRRFGVELPYEEQLTWGITRLRPEQLSICIAESHRDSQVAAGRPYPGAVEAVRRWHERGHFIHITSHRPPDRAAATAAWLQDIGLPFDDLRCGYDKVARCRELNVDLLIDDSPINLEAAIAHEIVPATIAHPWNRDVCDVEGVLCAPDWPQLERLLSPVLAAGAPAPAGRR